MRFSQPPKSMIIHWSGTLHLGAPSNKDRQWCSWVTQSARAEGVHEIPFLRFAPRLSLPGRLACSP